MSICPTGLRLLARCHGKKEKKKIISVSQQAASSSFSFWKSSNIWGNKRKIPNGLVIERQQLHEYNAFFQTTSILLLRFKVFHASRYKLWFSITQNKTILHNWIFKCLLCFLNNFHLRLLSMYRSSRLPFKAVVFSGEKVTICWTDNLDGAP